VALGIKGAAPYRAVLTHGWVLDAEGKPMSKSLANFVPARDYCEQYGADVFRLATASVDYQADVRLGSAIECIAEGIALYDSEDRLILCNQRYREILDRCKPYIISSAHYEDILRHAVLNGQFGETSADLEGFIQKLLAGHRGSRESFEQKFSDGRWVRIEERQTKSGGIISVLTDVTERKKLDMMKGEFISIVGHELRTPLTAIKGSLALLESRAAGELSAKAAAMINIAHKNSDRLVRLINDILDLQKIESGKMQFEFGNVAVETLLEQAVSANRSFAEGYDVGIELNEPPDSMLVLGDSDRLMQVMTNLLSNAVKFSPSGGTITVAGALSTAPTSSAITLTAGTGDSGTFTLAAGGSIAAGSGAITITAMRPFITSMRKTAAPIRTPATRVTFVAPTFPLPMVRISTRLTRFTRT